METPLLQTLAATPLQPGCTAETVAGDLRRKGGWLGRLLIRGALQSCRLEYMPAYRVRLADEASGTVRHVMVEGVTMSCGLVETEPELVEAHGPLFVGSEACCTEAEAIEAALRFVRRVESRLLFRAAFSYAATPYRLYRPHWIGYYGPSRDDLRHFLHFPADGFSFYR